MQLTDQSGARHGRQQYTNVGGAARRYETRQFALLHPREEPVSAPSRRAPERGPARYIGQIDARLCPGGEIPALDAVLDPPLDGAQYIKRHAVTDVYRLQWAGHDVVVKRYNHVGLFHSLRHTIKGSRARRGWRNGQRLLSLGIPTPRPIARIDEYRGPLVWRSWLITEYVDGPNLDCVLDDSAVPMGRKRRLIRQTLRLIDRLGAQGISHGDTKHTNILSVAGRAVLTDLDGIETHRWEWLHRRRRRGDIARFLRDMVDVPALWGCPEASREACVTASQSRGREFTQRTTPDGLMYLNEDFACGEEFIESLRDGQESLCRRYAAEVVESSRNSRVLRFRAPHRSGERTFYFKEYVRRSWLDWLKGLVGLNRAVRAFRASLMLADAGFLSPTVVAAGWLGHDRLRRRSFLITEEVADAQRAYEYLISQSSSQRPCTLRERRDLLRSLGRTIGRMHRAGIVHGDLRPGNVLARQAPGGWEFFLIDNERTRKWPWVPRRLRLKNLVQINMLPPGISRTDRMRFFQAYMLANPSVCAAYKPWATRIMMRTRRRFRRKGWA